MEPKLRQPADTADDILRSLRAFESLFRDRREGTITRKDLETLLLRHGDRLTPDAVAQFFRFIGCEHLRGEDQLSYEALVTVVVNASRAAAVGT